MFMNENIRLIALDLDGTLYNSDGQISIKNRDTLKRAIANGITVIIATGRPFVGLPVDVLKEIGIEYAITANGAGIYRIDDRHNLFEDTISPADGAALLRRLYQYPIHLDAFINGNAYTQTSTRSLIDKLQVPPALRTYIRDSRIVVDDLPEYVLENGFSIQKLTLNFIPDSNGVLTAREDIRTLLQTCPEFHCVSGGYCNLEVNKSGVSKAKGLHFLCETLGIPLTQTLACGDSENDYAIITEAGIGVAMANAEQLLLDAADYVSCSNNEDGVACAVEHFLFST